MHNNSSAVFAVSLAVSLAVAIAVSSLAVLTLTGGRTTAPPSLHFSNCFWLLMYDSASNVPPSELNIEFHPPYNNAFHCSSTLLSLVEEFVWKS